MGFIWSRNKAGFKLNFSQHADALPIYPRINILIQPKLPFTSPPPTTNTK